jgi:hypothetical protein
MRVNVVAVLLVFPILEMEQKTLLYVLASSSTAGLIQPVLARLFSDLRPATPRPPSLSAATGVPHLPTPRCPEERQRPLSYHSPTSSAAECSTMALQSDPRTASERVLSSGIGATSHAVALRAHRSDKSRPGDAQRASGMDTSEHRTSKSASVGYQLDRLFNAAIVERGKGNLRTIPLFDPCC